MILDTLAYSPSVRKRVSILAGPVGRRAGSSLLAWPKTEAVWVAYSLAERRSTLLRLLATLILGVGVAAAVSFLPLYVWLGIVIGLLAIGAVRMFAFRWGTFSRMEVSLSLPHVHAGSGSLGLGLVLSGPPEAWLQLQLREAGDGPLSIAVIGFDGPVPAGELAALVTAIANTRDTTIHYLTADEFLVVGSELAVHLALSAVKWSPFSMRLRGEPPPVTLLRGEAVYPRDGSTPDELIAKARQKAKRHAT